MVSMVTALTLPWKAGFERGGRDIHDRWVAVINGCNTPAHCFGSVDLICVRFEYFEYL